MPFKKVTDKTAIRRIVLRIVFTLLLAGSILFIFTNSSVEGALSGNTSQAVTAWINGLFSRVGVGVAFSETLVRKLGHLAEFMLLGLVMMLTLRVYTARLFAHIGWPLFFGLFIAVLDEFYQRFVPGRSSEVTDVLIDFAGVLVGVAFGLFILLIVRDIGRSIKDRRAAQSAAA